MSNPKVIDLFAGVGGLSLGFEMAGFDVVLANEIDEQIANAYVKNRQEANMIVADLTKIPIANTFKQYTGNVDVVVGGPPCQGFSQKGQRKSINDERNFLFKYFYQVVEYVGPKYFLIENVPNLLTAENGFFQSEICSIFNNIGYSISADVLNASMFGVPQHRRRAFILGKRDNIVPGLSTSPNEMVTIWDAISDLAYLESGEGDEEQLYITSPQSEYQKRLRNEYGKLYNHVSTKHSQTAIKRLEIIPPGCGREMLPSEHLTKSIYSGTWSRMKQNEASVTITTRFDTPSSGMFTHPFLNRAITVREAARLQSFPDAFRFYGNKGSQMKQVGNAVPPLLAKAVADIIYQDMSC